MLVRDIMSSPAVAIPPDTTLEDAYRIHAERASGTCRCSRRRLVGVVTDRDLRLATSALALRRFSPEAASPKSCRVAR